MTGTKKTTSGYVAPSTGYRELSGLNQSMLGKYDDDPAIFYQEFILGNPKKEKDSTSLRLGNLVDFFMVDCGGDEKIFEQRMNDKFALFEGVKSSAQVFDLADELVRITVRDGGEDGVVRSDFEERFKEAFNIVQGAGKFKGKTWEKGLEDFNKSGNEYFTKKIENIGKIVVDEWEVNATKSIASQAKGDEFLGSWINGGDGDMEIIKKHVIEFEIQARWNKWSCKMEQDETRVDHENKVVYRIDHKTAYENEEHSWSWSYLKRKYYLQNAFYDIGTRKWAKTNGMGDYEVKPMEFIVYDTSINKRRPLKYETNLQHVIDGMNGFTYRGVKYRGVLELIDGIDWAVENGIWNISRENYINKGIISLQNYENE